MGRLNVTPPAAEAATRCSVRPEMHYDPMKHELHNVGVNVLIRDDEMTVLMRSGVARIECRHTKDPSYDGVDDVQYCNDPVLRLHLVAGNGTWVYCRTTKNWNLRVTGWRWPD